MLFAYSRFMATERQLMQAAISHRTVGMQTKRILGRDIIVQFCRSFHKAYIYIRRLLLFR